MMILIEESLNRNHPQTNHYFAFVEKRKESSLEEKGEHPDREMLLIEKAIYGHLNKSILYLSRNLPNLKTMLSPDLTKVSFEFELLNKFDSDETQKMFDIGMLNGHVCVNARTGQAHTECDSSYTTISVPSQLDDNYVKLNPTFHFVLNNSTKLILPMKSNVSFTYSGWLLSHHQVLDSIDKSKGVFINLATYGNKRLFDNMMKSFRRTF